MKEHALAVTLAHVQSGLAARPILTNSPANDLLDFHAVISDESLLKKHTLLEVFGQPAFHHLIDNSCWLAT